MTWLGGSSDMKILDFESPRASFWKQIVLNCPGSNNFYEMTFFIEGKKKEYFNFT